MWNPIRNLARVARKTRLEEGPVSNNLQLCTSKHLGDYQWLFTCVVVLIVAGLIMLVVGKEFDASKSPMAAIAFAFITTAVAMFNWVYQAANRRLGVVDLFASEVSALCKVCIVTDFSRKSIAMREAAAASATQVPRSFDTKESYTPVYDKGSADLQALDSNVVSAITQFYTYRRTMVDCLHMALAQTERDAALPQYDQMIYMQFLMYECARTAVHELIEFEPDQAENLVTVLCSELPLITFLIKRHRKDPNTVFLYRRLCLRVEGYMTDVDFLLKQIATMNRGSEAIQKGWSKAITTGEELEIRFNEFKHETRPEWEQCQADKARRRSNMPHTGQPPLKQAA
jgi:hypothetical protein